MYLFWKKIVVFGADIVKLKSVHQHQKQPVLGPAIIYIYTSVPKRENE